ncbi:MAG: hypothetical protein JW836_15205 [Deltaproteobacteria bacterium]|nr:hypothetical protein [Deltaproteobacteria bacterium]
MAEPTAPRKFELDEVMLAMDVVDTLRHRRSLVEQELQSEDRERELIEKLRKTYADQGLEVSDEVIARGVRAMREERFTYRPPGKGVKTTLAHMYVNRGRWAKVILILFAVLAALWVGNYFISVRPAERERTELARESGSLDALRAEALKEAREPGVADKIEALFANADSAAQAGNLGNLQTARQALQYVRDMLRQEYTIQIVSRPGTPSGVWRYPAESGTARNYYLIVEAMSAAGQRLKLPITSEEDGKVRTVSEWGLRVDRQVYEQVRRDKEDDGIVNRKNVGVKKRGYLSPEYSVSTTGAAITEW